jgi:NTP pyrophosphatase (non-canonical NTP hydrolase)
MKIAEIQHIVHQTAVEHGWWENTTKANCPVAEKIALMHSELSEALEEYRHGIMKPLYFKTDEQGNPKPEGIAVELADCVIRILDLAGFMGWEIQEALILKMEYNEGRPYRHGNKKI